MISRALQVFTIRRCKAHIAGRHSNCLAVQDVSICLLVVAQQGDVFMILQVENTVPPSTKPDTVLRRIFSMAELLRNLDTAQPCSIKSETTNCRPLSLLLFPGLSQLIKR